MYRRTIRIGEEIQEKLWRGLTAAGRDWRELDRTLHAIGRLLLSSEAEQGWESEYREFLAWELRRELSTALDRAVELEEYEWAAAIKRYLDGLGPVETVPTRF